MSRYKITDQFGLNYLTLTVVDWLDVFTRPCYRQVILDSLRHCQKHKGLKVFAYVIMTNHIHLIVKSEGDSPLSDIMRDFKKFTARTLMKMIEENKQESRREWLLHKFEYNAKIHEGKRVRQFWLADNHPIELFSVHVIAQKVAYIHHNPVKAGFVAHAEHFPCSSASNYVHGTGLLDVDVIELPVSWEGYVQTVNLD